MKESLDLLDFELVVWHLSYYVCSRSGPGFISLSPQENHGCFKTWTLAPKHQFSPPINHYVPRARCDPSRGSSGSAAKPMTEQSANGLQLVQQKCTNQVCWAKTKLHFQFCMRCMILLVPHQFFTLEKKWLCDSLPEILSEWEGIQQTMRTAQQPLQSCDRSLPPVQKQ